ncbi:MAG TPA: protein kinase [Labilithrix sp.]|nr:protein kinase [Labilithrix sp.]
MSEPGVDTSGVPSSVRVQPGDVIAGKYEVERVLAEGGMGVVLAAQHKQLRRRVALKFLLPELCHMSEVVTRFLREAQAMTSIQNEHVARVLDVGTTAEGAPYMVMEYLEGEDLSQALDRRQRLPAVEAVEYVLQAMEALAEAHVHGFVHRDLKPSNLFITRRPDGSPLVKVLDFGISKVTTNDTSKSNVDLTHARGLLGSPLYMSPEQIRSSKTVDHRADIWTLGIILHELITGRPPFEAESVPAVLAQIVADEPIILLGVDAEAPPGMSEVVLKCLRRNRDERYANVAELAVALKPYATRDGLHAIEKIERVIAHNQRVATPVDLRVATPQKGLTPVVTPAPKTPAMLTGLSPLAATAHAPTSEPPVSGRKREQQDDATFGKYKLLAVLGQGGMADVFLAVLGGPEGLGFSKLVVIKRLRSNLASDPEFVSMLVDEARIAAKLNHPNVVQTHEVGVISNEYYIAMEFLDGQPLNRIVQRARALTVPLAFRLGIVRDLLAGVHHAHELPDFDGTPLGLVHRDVTPQNVFVTYEGQVKVVDFGIAKAKGRATETAQGVLKGKVAYMAPEQAGAKDVDRRADVFGAGVVLWELLTGERMWKGVDDVGIMQKLLLDKIPSSPKTVNPDVPKALDAMVRKALARKASDRFQTAQAFQLEIERYMEAEGLKCTARELGEWISSLFADRRKQTRSLIEAQLSALRTAGQPLRLMELRESGAMAPSTPTGLRLERLDHEPVPDDDGSRPDSVMARSHPGHSGSTTWATGGRARWAIAGVGALVVGTVILVALTRLPKKKTEGITQTTASTEGSASSSAVALPSVLPSAHSPVAPVDGNIHISLASPAPGAEFTIDDGPKMKGPVAVTMPRNGQPHRIVVSAPGFRPETRTVSFDENVSLQVPLVPVHGGAARPPAPSTRPVASVAASIAAPTPTAPTTGRKKRELDPDNPYAGQN